MSTGGGGGLFGGMFGQGSQLGPRGPFGAWPGCGCGSLLIILAGMLLVCGGVLNFFGNMFRF
jgi:hypothetical protein